MDNTNSDNWSQRLLGTHRLLSEDEQKRLGPAKVKAERKRKAQQKMADMSPEQKKKELKRLKDKYHVSDLPPKRAKNVKVDGVK